MVVVNDSCGGVSMDEANILADFFNLQANKHGPELLKKLNNLGGGESTKQHGVEQRKQIKIEDEAETVMKSAAAANLEQGYRKQFSSSNNSHKDLRKVFNTQHSGASIQGESDIKSMTQSDPNRPLLVSQDGQVVSILPDHILKSWPLLQHVQQATAGPAVHVRGGGVSVIQKVPKHRNSAASKAEYNNPNIILERRPDPGMVTMVGANDADHAPVRSLINSLGSHTTLSLGE